MGEENNLDIFPPSSLSPEVSICPWALLWNSDSHRNTCVEASVPLKLTFGSARVTSLAHFDTGAEFSEYPPPSKKAAV